MEYQCNQDIMGLRHDIMTINGVIKARYRTPVWYKTYTISTTKLIQCPVIMLRALRRNEINIRALGFSYDRPNIFVRSQWQKTEGVSILYLVYRWLFSLFFLSVWFYSLYEATINTNGYSLKRWPIYLTHWGYTLCTAQAWIATCLVTQRFIKEKTTGFTEDHAHMPRLYKTYWFLHTLSVVIAAGITGSYFVVDYNPATHNLTALNLLVHAFNSILMITDTIIVAHPFRLLHVAYTFSFIVFYFCFTVVYYLAGGTGRYDLPYIYPALDWRNVEKTLPVATLGAMSVILSHFCIWLVVLARRRIANGAKEETSEEVKISRPSPNQVQPTSDISTETTTKNFNVV